MATLQQQILRRKPVTQMTEETGTDSRSPSDQRRAREHERPDDRGPGDRHGLREHDEDAGADRCADAEQRELEEPDRPRELALAGSARAL